jgi:WD40 repeat protein
MSGGLPGKLVSVAVVGLMLLAMSSVDQAADEAVPRLQPSAVVLSLPPKLPTSSVAIPDVLFGPDGKHLYVRYVSMNKGKKDALECWKIRQGGKTVEAVHIWQNEFDYFVRNIAISPDGKYLAVMPIKSERGVLLFDPTNGKEMGTLRTEPPPKQGKDLALAFGQVFIAGEKVLAFSPDSRWLAGVVGHESVQVWDVGTRRTVRVWHFASPTPVMNLAFGPDGKTLVISGPWDHIVVWNVVSKELKAWPIDRSEFDPDIGLGVAKVKDRTFCIFTGWHHKGRPGRRAGAVQVRDENGKVLYTRTAEELLESVAVSPNGRWFATGESKVKQFEREVIREHRAYLWETETGKLLAILEGAVGVAVSPNGDWLAAAGEDGTVRLWKVPETLR